jgi:MFS family permease
MTADIGTAVRPDADEARSSFLLMVGKFLSSLAFFSAAPYLTLYLSAAGHLSPAAAGAAVGSIALIAGAGGVLSGYLIDRFGAVPLMRLSLVLYSAVYFLLALTRTVPLIVAAVVLMGVARLTLEPSVKKLMSASAGDDAEKTFRRRFVTIAVAAIVGPAIGGVLYYAGGTTFFLVPAVTLAIYLLFVMTAGRWLAAYDTAAGAGQGPTRAAAAFRDRRLLLVVVGGLTIFTVYSQFDSAVPLLMRETIGHRAVVFYSALLMADAVMGIAFQKPVTWLARRWERRNVVALGCACLAASFLLFGLMIVSLAFLVPGLVAFSGGEAILIPIPDVMLHEIASPELKGTYYGIGESRYLGYFIGPVIGGVFLQAGRPLFGVQAAVIAGMAYLVLARVPNTAHRPQGGNR